MVILGWSGKKKSFHTNAFAAIKRNPDVTIGHVYKSGDINTKISPKYFPYGIFKQIYMVYLPD